MTHRPPSPPDYAPPDSPWSEQNAAQIRAERLKSAVSIMKPILVLLVLAGVALFVGSIVGASTAHQDTKPAWAYERVNR